VNYDKAILRIGEKTHIVMAYGEEEFYTASVEREFLSRLKVEPEDKVERWSASKHSSKEIAIYFQEISMLGGRNILILTDPAKLTLGKMFEEILDAMPDDAYLCVICEKEKPPKWMSLAARSCLWVECEKVGKKPKQLLPWIKKKARDSGFSVSSEQASLILERVGGDSLRRLDSEMTKIGFIAEDGKIDDKEMKQILVRDANDLIPVIDAIYEKNTKKALMLLTLFLEKNGTYLPFISLLQRNIEKLCSILYLSQTNMPKADIAKMLNLPLFVIEKELKKAKNLAGLRKFKHWFRDICAIERQSRRNPAMLSVLVESLIIDMTRQA